VAIVATNLTNGSSLTAAGPYTTASVTVAAGDWILVSFLARGSAPKALSSVADNFGTHLTWSSVHVNSLNTSRDLCYAWAYNGTGVSQSGTLSLATTGNNSIGVDWSVDRFTGAANQAPASTVDNSGSGTPATAGILSYGPGDAAVFIVAQATNATASMTSFTFIGAGTNGVRVNASNDHWVAYDASSPPTSLSMTIGAGAWVAIGLQIKDGGASASTIAPSAVASTEAFGGPAIQAKDSIAPTGVGSDEAFGAPSVQAKDSIAPSGVAGTEAFGSPSVQAKDTIDPSGIVSTEGFGSPSITSTTPGDSIAPAGIASGEALGTPSVQAKDSIAPAGIVSDETFGAPSVQAAPVTIAPAGLASDEGFGSPSINSTVLGVSIAPLGIGSTEGFGTPAVDSGVGEFIAPSGIASDEAVPAPGITVKATIVVISLPDKSGVGTPHLDIGPHDHGAGMNFSETELGTGVVDGVPIHIGGYPTVRLHRA